MFIDRDAEIAVFERALAEEQPALIVVTGEPNIGKSSLLEEFRRHAQAEERHVIPDVIDQKGARKALSIEKETTKEGFLQAVASTTPQQAQQQFSPNAPFIPTSDEKGGTDVVRSTLDASPGDRSEVESRAKFTLYETEAGESQESPQPDSESEPSKSAVILIDGYHPTKTFEEWFITWCASNLKYLIVVAASPSDTQGLAKKVAEVVKVDSYQEIRLGDLSESAVRSYLLDLSNQSSYDLKEDEIGEYAKDLSKKPSLIEPLETVLKLLNLDLPGAVIS